MEVGGYNVIGFLLIGLAFLAIFLPRKFPGIWMVIFGVAMVYSSVISSLTHLDGVEITGMIRYSPPIFAFGFGWSISAFRRQRDSQRKKKAEEESQKKYERIHKEEMGE